MDFLAGIGLIFIIYYAVKFTSMYKLRRKYEEKYNRILCEEIDKGNKIDPEKIAREKTKGIKDDYKRQFGEKMFPWIDD